MRFNRAFLVVEVAGLILAIGGLVLYFTSPKSADDVVRVTRVIDGDTIEIEGGVRVRYLGVDAPEVKGGCYASEATTFNRSLVEGKSVRLVSETTDRDDYGRLLRYVLVDDIEVSVELLRGGYARTMAIPPDTSRYGEFKALQDAARIANLGLWGLCP